MFPQKPMGNEPPFDPPEDDVAAEMYRRRQEATYQWRLKVFVLALEQAGGKVSAENVDALDELARAKADTHAVIAALVAGCTPELAARIFV